ncbi:glycosyl transferase [Siphonobacter sp. BAB-5405]|uniref:glycosyltransferase family 9 protein n=1 Tax=Siphonobacter sp. BAB-5405 TaxID=1864825 RepID=UPI000C7FBAFF|nr:glycosyltransferase family 9 protein [Siphonobacter sp. BAB-5405]PMD94165.1 glycosyl transferase [Siphonobacter sp. BAB-5405]
MDKFTCLLGYTPERIAVFRALKVGDLLCAVPAFRALRRAFPNAHISLISLPWAEEFVGRYAAYFDEFIPFPGYPGLPEQALDASRTIAFLQEMQGRNFDVVLQMQGNGTIVNAMVLLLGAKATAGYYPTQHAEQFCPDERLFMPYPPDEHEVKRHVRLMEFLGIPTQDFSLEFPLTKADARRAEALSAWSEIIQQPFVCIHPGGISARRWPASHFAKAADALAAQGYTVVLTGTQPEEQTVEEVRQQMHYPALSVAGATDLGSLGWVLRKSSLLLSNDTGVAHLAVALQVPSVVIYTTSRPEEWGPLNPQRHRTIREAEATDPERVIEEAMKLLAYQGFEV